MTPGDSTWPTSRRRFLTATGAAAAVATTAGCLGGDSGGGGGDATPSGETIDDLPYPTEGPDDPPVTMTVYVDFECPHCHDFEAEVMPVLRERYISEGQLARYHGDFPIPVSDWSEPAAMAARAVQHAAGDEAFWEYAAMLFENQGALDYDRLGALADELSADVDAEAVVSMAETRRTWPVVKDNRDHAQEHGITGTPGVLVNDQYVEPAEDRPYVEVISDAIEAGLE